jgi:hypothetical protein
LIFLFLFARSFLSNFPISLFSLSFSTVFLFISFAFFLCLLFPGDLLYSPNPQSLQSFSTYQSTNSVFQKLFFETLNNLAKNCFKTFGGKTNFTNLKVFVIIFILCMLRFCRTMSCFTFCFRIVNILKQVYSR